ncbi:MAG: hypothetical protein LBG60_12905 [Bifidobacteriaceae bacterium]|jgi:hypothetical protein|nr:hypothetical protein [Bifidobacteriaceae bacterium]
MSRTAAHFAAYDAAAYLDAALKGSPARAVAPPTLGANTSPAGPWFCSRISWAMR